MSTTTVEAVRLSIVTAVKAITWTSRAFEKAVYVGDDDLEDQTGSVRNFEVQFDQRGGVEGDIQNPDAYNWFQIYRVVVFYPKEYDLAEINAVIQSDGHDIKRALDDSGNWVANAVNIQNVEGLPRSAVTRDAETDEVNGFALVVECLTEMMLPR